MSISVSFKIYTGLFQYFNIKIENCSFLLLSFTYSIVIDSPSIPLEQSQQKQGLTDRYLTEFQLNEIARIIRDYWKDLGRALGLAESQLVNIEKDNTGSTHEQKYAVLLAWRDKLGPQATVRQLIAAMLRINQQFDANIVLMTCSGSS